METNEAFHEARLNILRLLIEHKAEWNALVKNDGTKISLELVLGECFKSCSQEQLKDFKSLVAARKGTVGVFSRSLFKF